MFTGLVETRGKIKDIKQTDTGLVVTINSPFTQFDLGESISVNGVCLTVVRWGLDGEFVVEVSPETLKKSSLGSIEPGSVLNLERAMRANQKVGGHFVTGHVDTLGEIKGVKPLGEYTEFEISYPKENQSLLVEKGSVAVDGVSLTVNELNDDGESFMVMIIPHTMENTLFEQYRVGTKVNLEFDILGKYILRATDLHQRKNQQMGSLNG